MVVGEHFASRTDDGIVFPFKIYGAMVTVVAIDSGRLWRISEPLALPNGHSVTLIDDAVLRPYRPWESQQDEMMRIAGKPQELESLE